jgi:hypothetical protein
VYGPGPDPDEPGAPADGAGSFISPYPPTDCLDCEEVLAGSTSDSPLCPGAAEALAYLGDCACRACSVPCTDSCLAGDEVSSQCIFCLQSDCDGSYAACLDNTG